MGSTSVYPERKASFQQVSPQCLNSRLLGEFILVNRFLDPFRSFDFWESASVAEVANGNLTTSFPSSTWLPRHLANRPWLSIPEGSDGRAGALSGYGGLTLVHWAVAGGASADVVSYLLSLGIPGRWFRPPRCHRGYCTTLRCPTGGIRHL